MNRDEYDRTNRFVYDWLSEQLALNAATSKTDRPSALMIEGGEHEPDLFVCWVGDLRRIVAPLGELGTPHRD